MTSISTEPEDLENSPLISQATAKRSLATSAIRKSRYAARGRVMKRSDIYRFCIFLVLQLGFIAFTASAWGGIPLNHLPVDREVLVKGFFTIVGIAWIASSSAVVADIINGAHSSEWSYQLSTTGQFVPGKTDRTSMLTSTPWEKSKHFLSHSSTGSFRVALLSSSSYFILSNIGPGAVYIDRRIVATSATLSIGNLTIVDDSDLSGSAAMERAWEIVHLDQVELSPFGFSMEPNAVMSWPGVEFSASKEYSYPSDIVSYNFSCRWTIPELDNKTGTWSTEERSWFVPSDFIMKRDVSSAIYPLIQKNETDGRGTSAFLFLGSNTTFARPDIPLAVDLSNMETSFSPVIFTSNSTESKTDSSTSANLATVLVCDPNIKYSSGKINLTRSRGLNSLLISKVERDGIYMGNMSPAAVNYMFARSLLGVVSQTEPYIDTSADVNFLAAKMFLNDTNHDNFSTHPTSIDSINEHMNRFISLSAKAFLDGFRRTDTSNPDSSRLMVEAEELIPTLALYTNRVFFYVTSILISLLILLLGALTLFSNQQDAFKLKKILPIIASYHSYQARDNDSSADAIEMTPVSFRSGIKGPFNHSESNFRTFPRLQMSHTLQAASFLLLETGFIVLAGVTLINEGITLSHDSLWTFLKGGFTVVVIFWQTVALYFGRRIVLISYSSEWYLIYNRNRTVIPGKTDLVSTLGSGWYSQVQHFLSLSASIPFRIAFTLSLTFVILSGVAPGSLQLVIEPYETDIPLEIGNMSLIGGVESLGAEMTFPIQRARLVSNLEQEELTSFGYSMEPNYLIAWPPLTLVDGGPNTYKYPSDVVSYNYYCYWEAPVILKNGQLSTSNTTWVPRGSFVPSFNVSSLTQGSSINASAGVTFLTNDWIEGEDEGRYYNTSITAFLVLGGEGSQYAVDLTGIPTSDSSQITLSVDPFDAVLSPKASVLVCDPSPRWFGAQVQLDAGAKKLSILQKSLARVNNLPEAAINLMLSTCLSDIIGYQDSFHDNGLLVNQAVAKLFFGSTFSPFGTNKPLEASNIAENLQSLVSSASKAYLDGYFVPPQSIDPTGNFSRVQVNATVNNANAIVLKSNRLLFVITVCVVGLAALLLIALFLRREPVEIFDLEHILRELTRLGDGEDRREIE